MIKQMVQMVHQMLEQFYPSSHNGFQLLTLFNQVSLSQVEFLQVSLSQVQVLRVEFRLLTLC